MLGIRSIMWGGIVFAASIEPKMYTGLSPRFLPSTSRVLGRFDKRRSFVVALKAACPESAQSCYAALRSRICRQQHIAGGSSCAR